MLERLCAHYEESTGWGVGRRCWGNVELCWQKWGWAALLQRVQGELFIIMAQAMPSDVDNLGGRWWSTLHFPPPFQSLTSLTLECNLRCLVLPLQRRLRQTWHHLFSHQRFMHLILNALEFLIIFPVFEILLHGVFDQRHNKSEQEDNLLNEDRQIRCNLCVKWEIRVNFFLNFFSVHTETHIYMQKYLYTFILHL